MLEALGPDGFKKMDDLVADGLRAWLAGAALRAAGARAEEDDETSFLLYQCVRLLQHLGKYGEAEIVARRVLALDEKLYGDKSKIVAASLNWLAGILR